MYFSNISLEVSISQLFFPISILIAIHNVLDLKKQVKNAFCFENCRDRPLFEKYILVISKDFLVTRTFFFTIDQTNFGNLCLFLSVCVRAEIIFGYTLPVYYSKDLIIASPKMWACLLLRAACRNRNLHSAMPLLSAYYRVSKCRLQNINCYYD